jgi:hypothetical protein
MAANLTQIEKRSPIFAGLLAARRQISKATKQGRDVAKGVTLATPYATNREGGISSLAVESSITLVWMVSK